ncbi:MAG: thiamine diphosphokinase [Clostridia bacterium]|nr:thiamine diphosphokinase [Clostridia bacterium]
MHLEDFRAFARGAEHDKKRCVIVGGADIGRASFIRKLLREDDFVVYCDSGLKHMAALEAEPNLIVGDFDSIENPCLPVETIVLSREKDDTDTYFAAKEGVKRGFCDFLLLGVTGGRMDHTLGNISILLYLESLGKTARIADDWSDMEIVSKRPVRVGNEYAFFSLLNITGQAEGITVRGAKYPLENGTITCEYQYGISNETLPGQNAEISVRQGKLLLVKVRPQDG